MRDRLAELASEAKGRMLAGIATGAFMALTVGMTPASAVTTDEIVSRGKLLVAIDTTTGRPAPGFRDEGRVDLKKGVLGDLKNGRYDNMPLDVITATKKLVNVAEFYDTNRYRPKYENFEMKPQFIMTSEG